MSVTLTADTPAGLTHSRTAARVAAAAAAMLAVSLFMTVAVMNVPPDPTDSELVAWWQDPGHRLSGVISGVFALIVAVVFPIVMNHVHALTETPQSPGWRSFARSMTGAVTAVWLVTGAVRATVGHLVDTMDEPLPAADVLRFSTALNYMLLGQIGMSVLALCILATSVIVLRTGVLVRWFGYVGVGCSLIVLGAVAAQYGAYTTPLGILWALCLSVAVLRRPKPHAQ